MFPIHDDNPTDLQPKVTIALIAVCCLVFLWQFTLQEPLNETVFYSLGVTPATLFHYNFLPPELYIIPPELTVITSMFLHGGFMHLAGNMLYLWVFGNNVEDCMGHVKFILFYLICGSIAAVTQCLMDPTSEIPTIGASGAVSGLLGAYLLLYPHAKVLVVIPIFFIIKTFRVPAMFVLGFWFLLQLISSFNASPGEPGIAWWAHISGFVAGMVLIIFFKRKDVSLFSPKFNKNSL